MLHAARLSVQDFVDMGMTLRYEHPSRVHRWTLVLEEQDVSSLSVYRISRKHPWEVGYVETDPSWRRMGLAASLFALAQHKLGEITHDVTRTWEGDAWARAVGGPLPRLHLID